MRQIEVAVVDDGKVVGNGIIGIVSADIEIGHILESRRGMVGRREKVASHLTENHRAVSNLLHVIDDTHHTVD